MDLIGTGMYPLHQAARLVRAEPRSLRRWLHGYTRRYRGQPLHTAPLWTTQFAGENLPDEVIGFRDLLELRMVAAFVQHGVDLRVIRATIEAATHYFGQDYPLTNRQFRTDGKRIFLQAIEAATGDEKIVDVVHRQFVFSDIISPSLYAGIEYADESAVRWFPLGRRKTIVLDPALQFGAPVIASAGIPTDTIHAAFLAEGRDRDMVARVFDITPRLVSEAVAFEQGLAA